MSLNVIAFPKQECNDIVAALRHIADDIESGSVEFDPTLAVVVLGHQGERQTVDGRVCHNQHNCYGLGKDGGNMFAVRGLLFTAATYLGGD